MGYTPFGIFVLLLDDLWLLPYRALDQPRFPWGNVPILAGAAPLSGVPVIPIHDRPAQLSLLTRVFLANASVLAIVALLLLFSPIEISFPVTNSQAVLIVSGFVVSLAVNLLLLRPGRGAAAAADRDDALGRAARARAPAGGHTRGRRGRGAHDRLQRHAGPARARAA
jgi:hypothetical protein